MSAAQPVRRRDAAATREAILAAAVMEFTEHAYARAGVRQIAERAGVTAMLINRYFGSKERLFVRRPARAQSAADHRQAVWGARVPGNPRGEMASATSWKFDALPGPKEADEGATAGGDRS
ncbi:helix-turn-helix domain-containing protein [Streptomyces sp. NPDC102347]|uniref:helix-turn-helix domain-containing protein n=1 Tax=Streptomyces sp. NPDC102347 TaxID=3366157 RepID=UPI0038062161